MLDIKQEVLLKEIVSNELENSEEKIEESVLELYSKAEEFDRLYQILRTVLMKRKFPIDDIRKILLCVDEAFSNAVFWGNESRIYKKVIVKYYVSKELFAISVEDQGQGFNTFDLARKISERSFMGGSPRGIFFINHYIDKVFYNQKGNKVVLLKYNQKAPVSLSQTV